MLFDGAARPGAKILVSGGSRCNVTNASVTEADFSGAPPHLLRRVLKAYGVDETVAFFREIGVGLHEEEHGKLFPDANRSRVVLQALLDEATRRGVVLRAGERVQAVDAAAGGGFRRAHDAGRARGCAGRAGDRRALAAEDGKRRPRTSDGRGARPLCRADDAGARAPRSRRLVSRAAVRRGAGGRDRGACGRSHERAAPRLAALDALRGERAGRARRVARLAAGAARGPRGDGRGQPASGRDFGAVEERPRAAVGREPPPRGALACSRGGCRGRWRRPWPARRASARRRSAACAARSGARSCTASSPGCCPSSRAEATTSPRPRPVECPWPRWTRDRWSRAASPGLFLVGEMLDVDGRIGGFNFQWAWSSAWVAAGGLARGL